VTKQIKQSIIRSKAKSWRIRISSLVFNKLKLASGWIALDFKAIIRRGFAIFIKREGLNFIRTENAKGKRTNKRRANKKVNQNAKWQRTLGEGI